MSPRGTPLLSFLPLGPVTSNSYPKAQEVRAVVAGAATKRRSSSVTSDDKPTSGFRILKVAPVHYGEHSGDHQEDWHDVLSSSAAPEPVFGFLSLGPVTSASYPKAQEVRSTVDKRRASSISSDGKSGAGLRFLKVAPVHYGEHSGDHQDDWHEIPEVAVE